MTKLLCIKVSAKYHLLLNPTHTHNNLLVITHPVDFEEQVTDDPNGETLTLESKMQPLQLDTDEE